MNTVAVARLDPLVRVVVDRFPYDVAQVLESSELPEVVEFISRLEGPELERVVGQVTADFGERLLEALPPAQAKRLIEAFNPHRAAALLARLAPAAQKRHLASVSADHADEIRALLHYPPDAAARLMDPHVTAFGPDTSIRSVIRRMRELKERRIQDVFVVDSEGHLIGAVPVQEVVLADRDQTLGSLATGSPRFVEATAPQEDVLAALKAHPGASLPVVDFDERLLGVLRQDELLATVEHEATASMVTMVGASKQERALSSPVTAVRFRHAWLQINLLTAFLAASVVGIFEQTIAQFTALAVLLPVVAGQSGNTGAQALAVTMRGLALREIRIRHWLRVAGKELAAGALNGALVALTTSLGVYVWSRSPGLSLVICVSMVISMMIAGLAGAVIPMFLTRIRQDPAQSSSVILTTVTDVMGFFSFLGIATLLSSML